MEPVIMDPTWALLTLVLTALVGLSIWLALMIVIQSRRVTKNTKRILSVVAFVVFMAWLLTLGDPHSSLNLETLYYRSINYLPDTRLTNLLKRKPKASTNVVERTNVSGEKGRTSITFSSTNTVTTTGTNK